MSLAKRVVLKRNEGKENTLKIIYGLVPTLFGQTFIAAATSDKNDAISICQLYFAQKDIETGQQNLKKRWPNATLYENNESALKWTQHIFSSSSGKAIEILVNGTDFQVSVWNALIQIPFGETRTYAEVAEMIGKPLAIRAAANAVANNEIAFLIPCHRVVSKNGNKLKYAWGGEIKQQILDYEQIKLH